MTETLETASSSASPLSLLSSDSSSFWGSSKNEACFFGHWLEALLPRLLAYVKELLGSTGLASSHTTPAPSLHCTNSHGALLGQSQHLLEGCSIFHLPGMGCHCLPCLCPCGRMNVSLLQLSSSSLLPVLPSKPSVSQSENPDHFCHAVPGP